MAAADDKCHSRQFHRLSALPRFQHYGVNVSFDMVHGNQRNPARERDRFGVSQSPQQRTRQTGSARRRNRVKIAPSELRERERLPDHRHDGAKVFARSQFRDHAAIFRMDGKLTRHHRRKNAVAILHNRRRRFVTGAFDRQYQDQLLL